MPDDLSSDELAACYSLILKARILHSAVNAGLNVELTKKNIKFPSIVTDDEKFDQITAKLGDLSSIAWLKEQRGE